ncbi:MAG: hypothetical protein M5U18_13125 [Dehalococcoidia bacterium]|nr:hypothetical protein [Dehalococcoidia bacterium]
MRQALRASVRRHAAHLTMLMRDINELAKEIETRAQPYAALTEITGVAPLTAGTLAGIIGSHAPSQMTPNWLPTPGWRLWKPPQPVTGAIASTEEVIGGSTPSSTE